MISLEFYRNQAFRCTALALAAAVAACVTSYEPRTAPGSSQSPQAMRGGFYKVGTPYQVAGIWYYPSEQPAYDQTGIASWYGPTFHGKATANGEVFDRNLMTAAHPTLPMPVNVRVTNLENGRSIVVRVNDRGPFVGGRLIDLSEHAAEMLGYKQAGTARVQVTYLGRAPLNELEPAPDQIILAAAPARPATPVFRPAGQVAPPPRPVPPASGLIHVSAPNPEDEGSFYIAAGAYASLDNANRVLGQLRTVGAQLFPVTRDGQALYLVRIGPFASAGEAGRVLGEVTALGHNGAAIVAE